MTKARLKFSFINSSRVLYCVRSTLKFPKSRIDFSVCAWKFDRVVARGTRHWKMKRRVSRCDILVWTCTVPVSNGDKSGEFFFWISDNVGLDSVVIYHDSKIVFMQYTHTEFIERLVVKMLPKLNHMRVGLLGEVSHDWPKILHSWPKSNTPSKCASLAKHFCLSSSSFWGLDLSYSYLDPYRTHLFLRIHTFVSWRHFNFKPHQ